MRSKGATHPAGYQGPSPWLVNFERPSARNQLIAGLASGLAVAAKYSARFLLPVVVFGHCLHLGGSWVKKSWFYAGIVLGFLLGEPYALVHFRQFWESVNPYVQFGRLPEGAVPGVLALLGLQLKNLTMFRLGVPLTLVVLAAAYRFLRQGKNALQVKILTQPHPLNQAFDWIERHLPRGARIQKGWPELPPLNPAKFQITNFFDQPRMADFREYFVDGAGKPRFS